MKKKHIQYSLRLFIGLFAVGTLVSCVNTKSRLGVRDTSIDQVEEESLDTGPLSIDHGKELLYAHNINDNPVEEAEKVNNPSPLQAARSTFRYLSFETITRLLRQVGETPVNTIYIIPLREIAFLGGVYIGLPLADYIIRQLNVPTFSPCP